MPPFRRPPDHELNDFSDDELIAYLRAAHGAHDAGAARSALGILAFGHWHNVQRRVALKVPAHHVEDLTSDIITAAIQSAFDGESVGEFVNWLKTITARAIADFFRRGPGREPRTDSLDAAEDEDDRGADEPVAPDEQGYVEAQDAIDRVLAGRSDAHRQVIERLIYEDLPAREAGAPFGVSEANAHQILSRFRRDLRKELGAEGDTS